MNKDKIQIGDLVRVTITNPRFLPSGPGLVVDIDSGYIWPYEVYWFEKTRSDWYHGSNLVKLAKRRVPND